eukprot:13770791-Alexandrium_andersonii.AAC.1
MSTSRWPKWLGHQEAELPESTTFAQPHPEGGDGPAGPRRPMESIKGIRKALAPRAGGTAAPTRKGCT